MLTTLNHLLVLHVFGNGFCDFLLHCLSRDWCEADQTVVSFLRIGVIFAFLQVSGTSPWPFKEWPCSDVSQLPKHFWASCSVAWDYWRTLVSIRLPPGSPNPASTFCTFLLYASLVRSSLFIQARLLPPFFDFLLVRINYSGVLRWSLIIKQLSPCLLVQYLVSDCLRVRCFRVVYKPSLTSTVIWIQTACFRPFTKKKEV